MAETKITVNGICEVEGFDGHAPRLIAEIPEGGIMLVERLPNGTSSQLLRPFQLHRGVLLAKNVVAGNPRALTHPASLLVLATTVLFYASALQTAAEQDAASDEGGA